MNNKKNHYLMMLLLAAGLSACGGEDGETKLAENSAQTASLSASQNTRTATTAAANQNVEVKASAQAETVPQTHTQQAQAIEATPPKGRLTGIIDMGEYKQAVIHTGDQRILYLQTEGTWDGWTVQKIEAQQLVLEYEGKQHVIRMSTMDAPELSENAKKRQELVSQQLSQVNQAAETQAEANTAALVLSEEEREQVNARLIHTRSEN